MPAVIVEGAADGYVARGAAQAVWRCRDSEVVVAGPAETGKTFACLQKLDAMCWKYPGMQAIICRKTYHSTVGTVIQTYACKVLAPDCGVVAYGGERPQWYDYPNGSRVWVGGMDNPDKILSSERDLVYVNQAEELTLEDWEKLVSRATGRAGNTPYAQVIGDCNPGPAHHWIKQRKSLTLLESRHEDNPTLFDSRGQITERGTKSLSVLDNLTGVRKQRLRHGRWVSAEGVVYEFDRRVHLAPAMRRPPVGWTCIRVIDFGYTNPFVCLWLTLDPDDRLYLYREWYMTGRTVRRHAETIKQYSVGETYAATIADHDAEDRATLAECGIHTVAAVKDIRRGIDATIDRFKVAPDGRPRLMICQDALIERDESLAESRKPVCTEQEIDNYCYPKAADGRPIKEIPVGVDDHGMDATRYGVMWVETRQQGTATRISVPKQGSILDRLPKKW